MYNTDSVHQTQRRNQTHWVDSRIESDLCSLAIYDFTSWYSTLHSLQVKKIRAISELLLVSVSKWVLLLNYCKGNEYDLHKNTQLIYIWMVVHQDSFWSWDMQQLGNGLLESQELFERNLLSILCFIVQGKGSSEKGLIWTLVRNLFSCVWFLTWSVLLVCCVMHGMKLGGSFCL